MGSMKVRLQINGGAQAMLSVLDGLVKRNQRSLAQSTVGALGAQEIKLVEDGEIRDAVTSIKDGKASSSTMACWLAAQMRQEGNPARLMMRDGVVGVVDGRGKYINPGEAWGYEARSYVAGFVGAVSATEGRVCEDLLLTLDDDRALPVGEIGTAIAGVNARQIKKHNLPPLYESGVRYHTERKVDGRTQELWNDYLSMLDERFDDCESLAAVRAGEFINEGLDGRVRCRLVKRPSPDRGLFTGQRRTGGGRLFHAVAAVRKSDGSWAYDDPSAMLGMPVPEWYTKQLSAQRAKGGPL